MGTRTDAGGKIFRRLACIPLWGALLASGLQADVVSYTDPPPTPSRFSMSADGGFAFFPQFDPSLGQLNSVTIAWTYAIDGEVPYGVYPGPYPTAIEFPFADITESVTGTADQTVFSQQQTFTGNTFEEPECQCYLPDSFTMAGAESPTDLTPYLGIGGWELPYNFLLSASANPDSEIGVLSDFISGTDSFSGTVTYDYTAAPEPNYAPMVLLSFAIILVLVSRHRRRSSMIVE